MNQLLKGMRVIEGSAFVAAPLGGMTMAQLGADVIRFDPPKGGLDSRRWPLTAEGRSLYWVGLNKGKRSIAVDTRKPEGRELITDLITAPGPEGGHFLTNFPVSSGWLAYETLRQRRPDLVMVNLFGNPDGSSAVDYTVNCAVGIPYATGPSHGDAPVNPVNHVLPAWDCITGVTAALGMVAADRHRVLKGEGQLIKLALADVAMAMVGNLGYIGEAIINNEDRHAFGNYLYGAYGDEFITKDHREVYVVAITPRQWTELCRATGLEEQLGHIEPMLGVDLRKEGDRWKAREAISTVLRPWFNGHTLDHIRDSFEGSGVCWGPYQTFMQMVTDDPRCSTQNPMFSEVEQPGIGTYLVPGSPLDSSLLSRETPRRAPKLGEHSDEVLSDILGMNDGQIGKLRDDGVVHGPVDL